jgi:Flp pilus assembly protein TadG
MIARPSRGRRGAVAVEAAIVYPVLLLILLLLVLGGIGVFRYQQVACLAQEGARQVCVRGLDWSKETKKDSPTEADIRRDIILPLAAGMDPNHLTVQVELIDNTTGAVTNWDKSSKAALSTTPGGEMITNSLRVTVRYRWTPGVLFTGSWTLTSVCEIPMSF